MHSLRKFLLTMVAAIVTLSLFGIGSATPAGAEVDTRAMEAEFIGRINDLRGSQGLPHLSTDEGQLRDVAVSWSASMADAGGISHRPNLGEVAPSSWIRLGENVGVGSSVEALHNAFVASPGHYRNLVDPAFQIISVGVVVRDGRIFVTENFMTVASSGGVAVLSAGGGSTDGATAAPAKACRTKKCKATAVRKAGKAGKKAAPKAKARRR